MEIEVGTNYIVRSGDAWYIGHCVGTVPFGITLVNAVWLSFTGRFSEFMKNGRTDEMEVEAMGDRPITVRWDVYQPWPFPMFEKSV